MFVSKNAPHLPPLQRYCDPCAPPFGAAVANVLLYIYTVFALMSTLSNPYGSQRPCRECERWGGAVNGTSHAVCMRNNRIQVQANGEYGCVFWVRASGSDDGKKESPPKGGLNPYQEETWRRRF